MFWFVFSLVWFVCLSLVYINGKKVGERVLLDCLIISILVGQKCFRTGRECMKYVYR